MSAGWSELPRRAFEHSSGRVIAFTRFVLAAVFFLALWVDPAQPVRATVPGYGMLAGYILFAAVALAISWRSWWWDYRLALPAMLVDVSAFLAAVFFTEGSASDFTSPFLAFFAFLMLAATVRWDWRVTLLAGMAVTALYLAMGLVIGGIEADFDVYRFGRRVSYMLVLTLIMTWFGLERRGPAIERFAERLGDAANGAELLDQALGYAASQSGARRAVIAWGEYEEPDVAVRTLGLEPPRSRLGPAEFDAEADLPRSARLFDRKRGRSLEARPRGRPAVRTGKVVDHLAELHGIDEGVALPLTGLTGQGELLLCDIEALGADHVQLGTLIAREVTDAFDRQATLVFAGETALARMRDSLARDLHDSVAQSLAGTSLRLEGLRAWIRDGGDPDAEIDAMKHSLREEQRHVRSLIARLRFGDRDDEVEAGAAIRALLDALAVQWGIATRARIADEPIPLPAGLVHELEQIVREAIANAVRHGKAAAISIALALEDGKLAMTIEDDGAGFPPGDVAPRPRSIAARIDRLGGRLEVATGPAGTSLAVAIPAGAKR